MPAPSTRPGHGRPTPAPRRVVVLAVAAVLGLVGCSPSSEEVTDAVAGLPGVISAAPACHEFSCTIEIEAEPASSAAELTDMLAAARTVDDAAEVEVSLAQVEPGRISARLRIDNAPAAEDAAVGELLAWAAAHDDLSGFAVERSTADKASVLGSTVDGTSIWPLAREAWQLASPLKGATLGFSRSEHLRQQSLKVEGSFPDGPVTVAEEIESGVGPGLTGVVVTPTRLLLGAINRGAAAELRALVADDPRLDAVSAEAAVTTNVLLSSTAAEPGTSQRLEPVLAALDGQPEVLFVTLTGTAVEAEVEGVRSFPRLVQLVRRRAAAVFVDTTIVLNDPRAHHRAEITPDGDDAVLDLMLGLLPTPGLRGMGIRQELEPDPSRTAVGLAVDVRQPGPGTGSAPPVGPMVTRLARLLSQTPGSAASYSVSVVVEDTDGRSADASWRVDRTPDGFELGEISGTDERQAEVRAAWERGVA